MDLTVIAWFIVSAVIIAHFFLFLLERAANKKHSQEYILLKLEEYEKKIDKTHTTLREEFGQNRDEINKSARNIREELALSLKSFEEKFNQHITNFTGLIDNKIKSIVDFLGDSSKSSRAELTIALKSFEEKFSTRIDGLTRETVAVFEKNRTTIETKLGEIQRDNGIKLEEMRKTVDEKLHDTLEKRLTESFKLVSDNLDRVQKGLGEMQNLATGVGDLKKVLSNVKTKGVLGEYQLRAILEQLLAPSQYAENVKTKEGSNENVEFAIKIPSKEDTNRSLWLPIDSKFPSADYEALMTAYDTGDAQVIAHSKKELENKIKKYARDIHEKYIDPPHTLEFAIMFLPFEGLYAEVLRIPSLFENIQNEFKITITGPTTISAFLNSLQMGFRSLAVERRTSEIWDLLGAVKTQFGKFAEVLEAAKKKLDSASEELAKTGTRSRQIEKRLKNVQLLPEAKAQKVLGNLDLETEEEDR
ncbi:MAG: DNA recombination protein RmuC [Spirochaetaceae bacterium]|nr:DNA recombination protein RmuC [Spirochaetaceae bacterium]